MQTPNDPSDPTSLEQLLGSLTPATPELDRDAVMYRAGMVTGKRAPSAWLWKFTTLLWCGISAILAGQLWSSHQNLAALQESMNAMANNVQGLADKLADVHASKQVELPPQLADREVANATVANATVANATVANATVANATVAKHVRDDVGRWTVSPELEMEPDTVLPYVVTAGSSFQQVRAHWERMDQQLARPRTSERNQENTERHVEESGDAWHLTPPTLWSLNQELYGEAL